MPYCYIPNIGQLSHVDKKCIMSESVNHGSNQYCVFDNLSLPVEGLIGSYNGSFLLRLKRCLASSLLQLVYYRQVLSGISPVLPA